MVLSGILAFVVVIGMAYGYANAQSPQVIQFSWKDKQVGVQDDGFTLTFNRKMNRESVEENLLIKPSLPGKISWSERKMTYQLTELPSYGTTYSIQLSQAKTARDNTLIEPFVSKFKTRDRAFVYLGVERKEQGRLVLYNLTQQKKTLLTPAHLTVVNFEPYPNSDRILFSAFPRNGRQKNAQQLYTVTTGLNYQDISNNVTAGEIESVLDSKNDSTLRFDLSANGKTLVVQRINANNLEDSELWISTQEHSKPQRLGMKAGKFIVSPNGENLAIIKAEGVTLVSLSDSEKTAQLYPEYDSMIRFSPTGSQKLMVKSHEDETRSLFLVTETEEKELFTTEASILDCKFEPREQRTVYCLKTEIVEADEDTLVEEPYLAAIDLETANTIPLLALPNYPDVKMTIAPDGIAILFDQVVATVSDGNNDLSTQNGQAISAGRLWILPLPEIPKDKNFNRIPPEELFAGFRPLWLP